MTLVAPLRKTGRRARASTLAYGSDEGACSAVRQSFQQHADLQAEPRRVKEQLAAGLKERIPFIRRLFSVLFPLGFWLLGSGFWPLPSGLRPLGGASP